MGVTFAASTNEKIQTIASTGTLLHWVSQSLQQIWPPHSHLELCEMPWTHLTAQNSQFQRVTGLSTCVQKTSTCENFSRENKWHIENQHFLWHFKCMNHKAVVQQSALNDTKLPFSKCGR